MGVKNNRFRLSRPKWRLLAGALYLLALGVYLYVGLQPIKVEATPVPHLTIPVIELDTPVESLERLGTTLVAPEVVAGAYQENPGKTLLIGHSSTVFRRLNELQPGNTLMYNEATYRVSQRLIAPKSEVDMTTILAPSNRETLILMTCAGQHLSGDDYTHRLILTAEIE